MFRPREIRALCRVKRPIGSALREIGSVAAHLERPVLSRFAGEITWRAEDGTQVKEGDPVVMFDTLTAQEDYETREHDLGTNRRP